jgi:hypothetical protein
MSGLRFELEDDPALELLRREVLEHRALGKAHVEFRRVREEDDDDATADAVARAFVRELGMKPPPKWTSLDSRQALTVATRVLFAHLGHDAPVMPVHLAARLARTFLEALGAQATFLTNGTLALTHARGWTPLTGAAFDTGLVGVSDVRVGLLWVEDED